MGTGAIGAPSMRRVDNGGTRLTNPTTQRLRWLAAPGRWLIGKTRPRWMQLAVGVGLYAALILLGLIGLNVML